MTGATSWASEASGRAGQIVEVLASRSRRAARYRQRWGFDWGLYRPIVEFSRKNGVPLAALNMPRELTQRLSRVGHGGLTAEEKGQLGESDFQVKEHRDYWYDRLAKLHGQAEATPERKERSYQVMAAWDGYMAAGAARFQQERGLRRLVILAGGGHVERGFGIPARAAKLTGGKVATVSVETGKDPAPPTEATTDFVVFVEGKAPEKK
jgi:aminopeptidase N